MEDRTRNLENSIPPRRSHEPRFLPGTMLDRRYRIVAPLGRGGMGDVFRADDLKLGSPVALKFLSPSIEQDPARLAMLLEEVKFARQVSHPNVCRVWDAGETEGLHYVAMEYVDGEDIGSLLRRIGRLPEERGIQVAREICAGLAAIHDQGVLHRDLKPANIMLDGRGRVRIADFGLAALSGGVPSEDVRSGTPAYMSPEQLEGREVSVRSDIYALGLVLYEVFTGRPAFASGTSALRPASASASRPDSPSSHVRSLDPIVERAILRCLEPDPALRPASALAVARALPGGDPLLAALSAGETPSPEMVAASGGEGGLRLLPAAGLIAGIVLGVLAVLTLSDRRGLPFGPEDKPYVALRDHAGEFLRAQDMVGAGDDFLDGFSREETPRGEAAPPAGAHNVYYWYRRSSLPVLFSMDERNKTGPAVFAVPALDQPGERALRLDLQGHLLEFRRVPSLLDPPVSSAPDWRPYFLAAGLQSEHPAPAEPRLVPPVPADTRVAWTVATPQGDRQVEAASYAGRVAFFVVGQPVVPRALTRRDRIVSTLGSLIAFAFFAAFLVLARRNLHAARGDVRGALRLAAFVFTLGILGWTLLGTPHLKWLGFFTFFAFVVPLFFSTLQGLAYLALEPIVRRQHPEWLASWSRILEGRWLDRLVGRDVLIGLLGGVVAVIIGQVGGSIMGLVPLGDYQAAAVGGRPALAVVLRGVSGGLLYSMLAVLLLALIRKAVRRNVLGWILWLPLIALLSVHGFSAIWIGILETAVMGLLLVRFGLLSMIAANMVFGILNDEYVTVHLGAWYSGVTVTALVAIGAFVTWASLAALRTPRGAR